jgi:hypothetical protein
VAERRVGLSGEFRAQCLDESRLADPGIGRQQHHLSFAVGRAPPAREQQMQLFFTTDKRYEVSTTQGVEAAFGHAFTHNLPSAHRLAESLEGARAKVGKLEQAAEQAARARGDYDAVRFGQGL